MITNGCIMGSAKRNLTRRDSPIFLRMARALPRTSHRGVSRNLESDTDDGSSNHEITARLAYSSVSIEIVRP
jgi:hypothetical protein